MVFESFYPKAPTLLVSPWRSLALGAIVLLAITLVLFAFTIPGQQRGEFSYRPALKP
jgi:hypothetical protein